MDPPLSALDLEHPPPGGGTSSTALSNGNLRVVVDAATGYVTATRVSDGAVLLRQTALAFGPPTVPGTRAGSASALVTFGGTAGERIYGLGEHRTGRVQQLPFRQLFVHTLEYDVSSGADSTIPWYASSLGYGFVWNSPGFGFADLSESALSWYANATLNADFWITTTEAGSGVFRWAASEACE